MAVRGCRSFSELANESRLPGKNCSIAPWSFSIYFKKKIMYDKNISCGVALKRLLLTAAYKTGGL